MLSAAQLCGPHLWFLTETENDRDSAYHPTDDMMLWYYYIINYDVTIMTSH